MEGLIKSLGLIAKVEDVSERTVSAYWSNFGNKDFDGDIIVKGAFKKTISDRSKENPILFLKGHNFDNHISTPHEVIEDSKGLLARYKLPNTTQGNDCLEMYKEGFYNQHSIGFKTIQQDKENDANFIKEIKLFEGSVVPFGANPLTPMVSITKSLQFHYDTVPNSLQEEYDNAIRLMKCWKGSDEAFLEIQVKALLLESYMKEPVTPEPIQAKSTRERIELKGYTYDQYAVLSMDKKETLGFLDSIEYGFKAIARNCGEGLISDNTATMATEFLAHCKDAIAKLESYEDQILNGTAIMETEESITMDGEKSLTDPLKGSQPKEAEPLKNIFTKSQLLEIENIFN